MMRSLPIISMTNFKTRTSCRMVVGVDRGQRRDWIADARRDRGVALQSAEYEGQSGGAHRRKKLYVFVFGDVPRRNQPRHRDRCVGDAAEAVGEAEIVHPHVAGVVARMNMNERARLVRRLPKWIEVGGIERRADAARQRADHGAGKARLDLVLEYRSGARAVAERHGRKRHEMRLGLGGGEQAVVGEPCPGFGFRARQLVTEHVDPAAGDLFVDALLGHPSEARRNVGQRLRHRPRRLAADESQGEAAVGLDLPHVGKLRRVLADGGEQVGRH